MPVFSTFFLLLILANLSFPGTLNFIGELFSIISLLNIDYSLIGLFLFNVLLTTCYSFFNMSIILLEQEVHKDTNRIEFILIIIGYNLIFILFMLKNNQ